MAAVNRFLDEWAEVEPGAEVLFSEIYEFYMRTSKARRWPSVSQVVMSRGLKAAGAKRVQKRLSATDKPVYYILPDATSGGGKATCDDP